MWGLLPVHTELHLSGILPAAICSPEFLKYQRKKIFDKKRTSLTDQWSFPWFLLGLVFDTLFTTECAAILSRGGATSASAASRGNGSCCVWCNCPKSLCECKEGLHWIFFPPFPLFLLKTQLELYNFDISITILSFNSYNRPQLFFCFCFCFCSLLWPPLWPRKSSGSFTDSCSPHDHKLGYFFTAIRPLWNKTTDMNLFHSNSPIMSISLLLSASSDV